MQHPASPHSTRAFFWWHFTIPAVETRGKTDSSVHPAVLVWKLFSLASQTTALLIMANIAPSALRQASRLASKPSLAAAPRRSVPALPRALAGNARAACKRCYVTQTKPDHAQVQVDTAIRLDRAALEKAGATLETMQTGSTQHVSPMAGEKPILGHNLSGLGANRILI